MKRRCFGEGGKAVTVKQKEINLERVGTNREKGPRRGSYLRAMVDWLID